MFGKGGKACLSHNGVDRKVVPDEAGSVLPGGTEKHQERVHAQRSVLMQKRTSKRINSTWFRRTRSVLITGAMLALAAMPAAAQGLFDSGQADRPMAQGKNGMVVAPTPIGAQIGQQILAQGGNAADALAATAAAVGLLEPYLSGPFGVGYLLYSPAESDEVLGLEFGGRGPAALDLDEYESDADRTSGGKSIAVPGNIYGWVTLVEEHGTMTVAEVFQPTIELAEEGFPLSAELAGITNGFVNNFDYEETRATYEKE